MNASFRFYRLGWLLLFCCAGTLLSSAQRLTGVVRDSLTGEPLPGVSVYYADRRQHTQTAVDGAFSIVKRTGETLHLSCIGYRPQALRLDAHHRHLSLALTPKDIVTPEATVRATRQKYVRKGNPAVAFMEQVIAHKRAGRLSERPYYRYGKYEKYTFALNEFTPKVFEEGSFKRMPFLKDHVEICPETGKLILPISYNESHTEHLYRKADGKQRTVVKATKSAGVNELFNTGDIVTGLLQEFFMSVDIYDEQIYLLRHSFRSPIATHGATNFYRYFLEDTVYIGKDRCVQVSFTPNNPQDFGFSGTLYVAADSSYRIRQAELQLPRNTGVNFVESLRVVQQFRRLPDGTQAILSDELLIELEVIELLNKFQVKRTTHYGDYDFSPLPDALFKATTHTRTIEPDALLRSDDYWAQLRPLPLTRSEARMGDFLKEIEGMKHFRLALTVLKVFIENFIETTTDPHRPSRIDLGPVNSAVSQNFIDGLRLRVGAQTTAALHPQLFGRGYVAYGFKDHRWKGLGELTYSFIKKSFLPMEYPVHNLSIQYRKDVLSPSDRFLSTDKDNIFTSFKFTKIDQMLYSESLQLRYEREWQNGLRITAQLRREEQEPTGEYFFQPLDGSPTPSPLSEAHRPALTTAEAMLGLYFRPGTTYINTKKRRRATNDNAPSFALNHTFGLRALGGEYAYNYTEAEVFSRFQLASWGKLDLNLRAGAQWNTVPFPLLIMPAANLSYFLQNNAFSLINNMEFPTDRFASFHLAWDLNGKLFNRVPLLQKLKWRERLGVSVLWGTLTRKNNPTLPENQTNDRLFFFPGHFVDGLYQPTSFLLDSRRPYVEVSAGVHNIFKLLHVEYVRRLGYLSLPTAQKDGIRLRIHLSF